MTPLSLSIQSSITTMRHNTGIVIPVYLPPEIDTARGKWLLRDTVASYVQCVDDPVVICLSVDGEEFGADTATQLAKDFGVAVCVSQTNRGKLQSASLGTQHLLGNQDLRYFAVVDQDGDHFANELLNLVRVGEHIETQTGTDRVLVLGQRRSPHRSMGFYRGELEELADRVLLDALGYHAAVRGCPLRLEYANLMGEFPDFHSGYKLFSRPTASDVFLSKPQKAGVSDRCYYYHACEAVMTVEAILHKAYLGAAFRSATNEQPVSTFGLYDHTPGPASGWLCRLHLSNSGWQIISRACSYARWCPRAGPGLRKSGDS